MAAPAQLEPKFFRQLRAADLQFNRKEMRQDRMARQRRWNREEDKTDKPQLFFRQTFFSDCQIFRHQDGATPLPTIILHDHHRRPSVRPSVRPSFPLPIRSMSEPRSFTLYFSVDQNVSLSIGSIIRPFLAPIQSVSDAEIRSRPATTT